MSRPRIDPIERIISFFISAPLAEAYDVLDRCKIIMQLRGQIETANVNAAKEQAVRRGRPLGSRNKPQEQQALPIGKNAATEEPIQ